MILSPDSSVHIVQYPESTTTNVDFARMSPPHKEPVLNLVNVSVVGLPTVETEVHPIVESPSVKLLGININSNMPWHDHILSIAKTASQKFGVLFRCRKLYTPEQLLLLYKAQIRPLLEYCSHLWGCSSKHSKASGHYPKESN
ncbi:unnamed protein product [Callosobruchus maculatus]|uniref:Uncharacterized protein n=1 Tax=Callosobruchus maculatus TaxID=64391 RepID=A0A653D4W2_CALMS|nr:unnamed protein product [Callosobruchus maculatus]